jgi:hypothetical protein
MRLTGNMIFTLISSSHGELFIFIFEISLYLKKNPAYASTNIQRDLELNKSSLPLCSSHGVYNLN